MQINECDKAIQLKRADEALANSNRGYVKSLLSQLEDSIADCDEMQCSTSDPDLVVCLVTVELLPSTSYGQY